MDENILLWNLRILSEFLLVILKVCLEFFKSCVCFFYVPPKELRDEVVVLTGAAGGFGMLIAEKMAKKGCKLVLLDINFEDAESLADRINESGGCALAYKCDITSVDEVKNVAIEIKKDIGDPTILINNAGVVAGHYFQSLQHEDVVKTFNVNTISHYTLIRTFLPNMLEKNHGHIVSIASILGTYSVAGVPEYGASKAAAISLMQSLRQEIRLLGKDGVHCTTVLPYQVNTEMFRGCGIRFRFFPTLNILCPDYVTNKIIGAIEKNQTALYLPRICYFLTAILNILPYGCTDALFDFLHTNQAMRTFVGRNKKK